MIKKTLSGLILLNIALMQNGVALSEIIEDEVAKQAFEGKNFAKPVYQKPVIEDTLAAQAFGGKALSKPVFCKIIVEDDTAPTKTNRRPEFKLIIVEDESLQNDPKIKTCDTTRPAVHYKIIDEKSQIVKIKISSTDIITTKNSLKVGDKLNLKITEDIYRDNEVFIKKDTPVTAYIELISESDWFGDPDEIEIGRLLTQDIKGNPIEIEGVIRKQGANRGKWVKPLYYIGSCAPFGAPLMLTYFIKGGKTKIKPKDKFEFYYE